MPFFRASDHERKPELGLVPRCGECRLHLACHSPKMGVSGKGKKGILIIGEAPGKSEDEQGRPFVGASGEILSNVLGRLGIDLRNDCWITNAASCRPRENKLPPKAVEHCRPLLVRRVKELNPSLIILLGEAAVRGLIGWLWKEDVGGIGRWTGWRIPCQRLNAWVCPLWHPAFLLRQREENGKLDDTIMLIWERQFKASVRKVGTRPWKVVPDFANQVRTTLDPVEAAMVVNRMAVGKVPVAVDYETDRLKPDAEGSRIVSCAVSDGETTLSYPWMGDAISATKGLLAGEVPKVASNLKFEHRWTWEKFGVRVNNWWLDTMIAAHVLDNRPRICSIKFQSFVLLGQESYDDRIKPYLRSDNSNRPNRIREAPLDKLLHYGALDALLEWRVAMIQAKRLGIEP